MEKKSILMQGYSYILKLENKLRAQLAKRPVIYTLIGGTAMILFWRGVWHTGDLLEAQGGILGVLFSPQASIIFGAATLLVTGLFVSFFVGDVEVLSGIKKEEKLIEKAEGEVKTEKIVLENIEEDIERLERKIDEFEKKMSARHPHIGYPQKFDKVQ